MLFATCIVWTTVHAGRATQDGSTGVAKALPTQSTNDKTTPGPTPGAVPPGISTQSSVPNSSQSSTTGATTTTPDQQQTPTWALATPDSLGRTCFELHPAGGFASCMYKKFAADLVTFNAELNSQCLQDVQLAELDYKNACTLKNPAGSDCAAATQRLNNKQAPCATERNKVLNLSPSISVYWFQHPPYDPDSSVYSLIIGGSDPDQMGAQLFVCSVWVPQLGVEVPGKLLKGRCNYAAKGAGTEADLYSFAARVGTGGYWAPPTKDLSAVLSVGGRIIVSPLQDGGQKPPWPIICHAKFSDEEGAFSIFGVQLFPSVVDHGTHIGQLFDNGCGFEWGGRQVLSTDHVEVYYLRQPPMPQPAAPTCGKPGQPPCTPGGPAPSAIVSVASCSVSPSSIGLGSSATLTATLSRPAPQGGITAVIGTSMNGTGETLVSSPQSLPFAAGSTTASVVIQTRNVLNPATRIVFSVYVGATAAKNAELDVH